MIFLLEIEVWEIWDPPAILKFNIVLKPNNLGKNKKQVMDWEKLKNYKESFGKPSENMVKVMKSIQKNLIREKLYHSIGMIYLWEIQNITFH